MTLPSVTAIQAMDRAALIATWSDLFEVPVPKSLSRPFLRRFLAFEVQARQFGGLPRTFIKDLKRQVRSAAQANGPGIKPGGRLLREWDGVTHSVEVIKGGYRWNGEIYRSLSAVARAITGAHWSGPRFFGLAEHRP
jgi:hypothetical protein